MRQYQSAPDIAVVTCFFNPAGYRSRVRNYDRFYRYITRANLYLLTVEVAFGDAPFALTGYDNVVRIRGGESHILWQKERLLNLALRQVPDRYDKIVWMDCDVFFKSQTWAAETSSLLDEFVVVQPFDRLVRLDKGLLEDNETCEIKIGFGYVYAKNKLASRIGKFHHHGHTGIAWAAQRQLLEQCSLYDVLVSGSGDHFMAHAFSNTLDSPCFDKVRDSPLFCHFSAWAARVAQMCAGSMSYVPGTVLHLWHGAKENRRYRTILKEMMCHDFQPEIDLLTDFSNGLLMWSGAKPALSRWGRRYFWERKEDES